MQCKHESNDGTADVDAQFLVVSWGALVHARGIGRVMKCFKPSMLIFTSQASTVVAAVTEAYMADLSMINQA